MELEPKSLNISNRRRVNWFYVGMAFACVAFGWLWHKPTHRGEVAVSCIVGGTAFWLVLGPGLMQLRFHDSGLVRTCFIFGGVAGLLVIMKWLVPLLHRYVATLP